VKLARETALSAADSDSSLTDDHDNHVSTAFYHDSAQVTHVSAVCVCVCVCVCFVCVCVCVFVCVVINDINGKNCIVSTDQKVQKS